jgi:asparagine synthase (glutamine-hydrolysing)
MHVARRDGLPQPIPFTYRFPGRTASEETSWQELVIAQLDVGDWMRPTFDDELDCLGSLATRLLLRNGLLSPPNAHFIVPALEAAGVGAVITGQGGDELFQSGDRARLARVLARREVPVSRDIARLLVAAAPARLRARRRRHEADRIVHAPWLRTRARQLVVQASALELAREPLRPRPFVRHGWQLRSNQLTLRSFELLGRDYDCELIHPFEDREVVSAVADWSHARHPASRAEALRELLGDVVPAQTLDRRTKATFDGAFWAGHSRDFALSLSPQELDSELVDGQRAIDYWTADGDGPEAPLPSSTLLQHVWLERRSKSAIGGGENRLARRA